MKRSLSILLIGSLAFTACKKKGCTDEDALNYSTEAEKDDGSCEFLIVPTTYSFTDASGNNTVSYSGQTDRLDQLEEMTIYMKTGNATTISASDLMDMFYNVGDNGGGNFTFSSTKQLANKCFSTDSAQYTSWFDSLATASISNAQAASNGQAGTLTSGTSTYLFGANGYEYVQLIEKGLMGAVFMNQALNTYFGSGKMDVDNTTAVDPNAGKYYTEMEHHWDEAFGYFGVTTSFPSNTTVRFWGKYCNARDAELGCNTTIMNAFLRGRAAVSEGLLDIRDEQILIIRQEWERVCAATAIDYLSQAQDYFGNDDAKFLHVLSEAYAFVKCLTYVPTATRVITWSQIDTILTGNFGDNLWNMGAVNIAAAKGDLENIYGL